QRSAGLVLLTLVGEVALSHIERLGHAFVEMCRNDRAGAHTDVQHDRPQRVIRVADPQRDVALTGERESIRLELIVEYFLIDHDTVSCASKSPPADLISEAARLFLELTARGRLDRAAPSLSPPQSRPPPGHKRDTDFSSHCCGCRFSAALTPYRSAAAVMTDLLSGQVQLYFGTTASSLEYVRTGKLRALAVTIERRLDALPDIPTVGEFVPGYEASNWYGLGAPKNTPAEIVAKLNKEINAGLADPKLRARLTDLGGTVLAGSPADFGKLIADETGKWGKVVKLPGMKAD